MSYSNQAERLNKTFNKIFQSNDFCISKDERKELIDTILSFGQVAKFRCRSNVAYDNFSKEVFNNIVELERSKLEGQEFDVLQVKQ